MSISPSSSSALGSADALSDSEYQRIASQALGRVEAVIDRWLEDDVVDIDTHRTGGLLELTLPNGSKVILNLQPPLQELWMAAQAGGYHYRRVGGRWIDTRSGEEFYAALSQHLTRQAGRSLQISAP